MGWPEAQAAIKEAVAQAAGLPREAVSWEGENASNGWMPDGVFADLRVTGVEGRGRDEERLEWDGDPETDAAADVRLLPLHCGLRTVTVSVRITTQDQTPGRDAVVWVADNLRTRIRTRRAQQTLLDANVGFIDVAGTINADFPNDEGRLQSFGIVDLRFYVAAIHLDDADPGDWVSDVEVAYEPA